MESEPAIWIPTALNLWRIPSLGMAIEEQGHQNDMAAPSLHRWVSWLWIAVRWYPEQFSAVTDLMFNEYTSISREGIQDLPLFFQLPSFVSKFGVPAGHILIDIHACGAMIFQWFAGIVKAAPYVIWEEISQGSRQTPRVAARPKPGASMSSGLQGFSGGSNQAGLEIRAALCLVYYSRSCSSCWMASFPFVTACSSSSSAAIRLSSSCTRLPKLPMCWEMPPSTIVVRYACLISGSCKKFTRRTFVKSLVIDYITCDMLSTVARMWCFYSDMTRAILRGWGIKFSKQKVALRRIGNYTCLTSYTHMCNSLSVITYRCTDSYPGFSDLKACSLFFNAFG